MSQIAHASAAGRDAESAAPRRVDPAALLLRVFTHPACAGCPTAVKRAWKISQSRPELELRTVSLEHEEGLAEARRARVTTIPTTTLSRGNAELERWVGQPEQGAIEDAVAALCADAAPAD